MTKVTNNGRRACLYVALKSSPDLHLMDGEERLFASEWIALFNVIPFLLNVIKLQMILLY